MLFIRKMRTSAGIMMNYTTTTRKGYEKQCLFSFILYRECVKSCQFNLNRIGRASTLHLYAS